MSKSIKSKIKDSKQTCLSARDKDSSVVVSYLWILFLFIVNPILTGRNMKFKFWETLVLHTLQRKRFMEIPEIENENNGEWNYKIHNCWSNGEVQRSGVKMILMKRHAAPSWLQKILPVVFNVINFCKNRPRKCRDNAADPKNKNHPLGPPNSCSRVES